jgi:hypothetical protein
MRSDEIARVVACSGGEFTPRRFFLRLDEGATVAETTLAPHLLVEATAMGQAIALPFSQAVLLGLPCIRGTHAAEGTALLEHEAVVERVALLLAAVVGLLVRGIGGAGERSRRAIRPTRGGCGTPARRVAGSLTERSSAWRAGRRS